MAACEQSERLNAYFDGELSPDEQVAIAHHVGNCPACTAELDRMTRLSRLLASHRPAELSDEARERLRAGVDAVPATGLRRMAELAAGIAAAILIASVIGLASHKPTTTSTAALPVWEAQVTTQSAEDSPRTNDELLAAWVVQDLSENTK